MASMLISSSAMANMPNINYQNVSGSDRVRTSDGASCDQAISTGKSFAMGAYGSQDDSDYAYYDPMRGYGNSGNDVGVYMGVSIQFGGEDRIDCKRMYNNEIERKELELNVYKERTKLELDQLRLEKTRLLQLLSNKSHFVD